MLKQGEKAPNFMLFDTDRISRSLSDYAGKNVVLFFFPLAFSSGCTAELCQIRDENQEYEKLNAEVIGISVDSHFALKKFKEELVYKFTLLSDWNKEVSRAYDVLYEEFILGMRGVSKRATFIIDGKGHVKYAEVLENAGDMPDFIKVKETLSSLN